jgi:hypothetical protein
MEVAMGTSTAKSPPTRRVMNILGTLAEYQIEIHLARSTGLRLGELDGALRHAQELLAALP